MRAIHGDDLSKRLRIYAFGASLGGQRVLDAAKALARQSGIPKRQAEAGRPARDLLAQRPQLGRVPKNDFVKYLIPFLKKISRR